MKIHILNESNKNKEIYILPASNADVEEPFF